MDDPNMQREEIDRVLHSKRKQRESKACYPCRQRKVKCDGSQPCRTCVKRAHPEICAYDVDSPRKRTAQSRRESHQGQSRDIPVPSSPMETPRSSGRAQDTSHVFAGDNSLVSILGQQDPDGSMAREATSVLGLHNTYSSYPFIDSRTAQERWVALLDILPHRNEVLKFFHFYRSSAYPFNPILVDVDKFESDICVYLGAYASGELADRDRVSEHWASPKSVGQISLLLATLAAGAHFSDLENPQRSEVCQDFARRSFQALRLANFLFRPSLDVVQAMLVLGNTLQNNGQSDAAWAFLGTTVRLAQTLGLHSERGTLHWPEHAKVKAKSLWSMTVWQDSLLSLCYDRPPIVSTRGWTPHVNPEPSGFSYLMLMHSICWIALNIIQIQELPQPEPSPNLTLLAELDQTYSQAQPHLRQRESCKNLQENLEHLALRMHVSFCVSVLCRPAIRKNPQAGEDPNYITLRARAKESLITASKAFLDFQALSIVPLRTWSMVHTVLSSTLLLCTWHETRDDAECRELQQKASAGLDPLFAGDVSQMMPSDEMFGFLPDWDYSPVTYLDSIMNVPLFGFPEDT
ncbi:hypothetical protein BDV18DRAFT_166241 [Aspergillus unguis]